MSSGPYKILIINWRDITHPDAGGAEIHLHEVAKRWVSWGHQVTFMGQNYPGGAAVDCVDGVNIVRTGGKYSVYVAAAATYLRSLKQQQFDVVVDSINAIPFFTPLYVRKPKVAIIYHLVGDISFMELPFPHSIIVYLVEKVLPWLYGRVPVITIAPSSKKELAARGFREENISFAYPALENSFHEVASGIRSAVPTILYLGRLKRYKGVDHLIVAMKQVLAEIPEAKLVIAGKGDYEPQLRRLAAATGVDRSVTFVGFVGEEQKLKLLQQSWVFVLTSKKEGGTSIAVAEAMACCVPAVGTEKALEDIIQHGESGFLVPYARPELLAERLILLLRDGELRKKMGLKAKEWSRQLSWDNTAAAMLAAIDDTLKKRKK